LLEERRLGERLVCRYLVDLADRVGTRGGVGPYADVYHLARAELKLGVRSTRERVRVGRALQVLPAIEQSFVQGEIGFSQVREITRVAKPEDESAWLAAAKQLSIRQLEKRVAEASGGRGDKRARTAEPAEVRWPTPSTVEVRLVLPAEIWAQLSRAMESVRRASEASLSDAEALEAVAREALARASEPEGAADPSRTVVLYECRDCRRTELETGTGAVELDDGAAAALGCGHIVRDLRTEGRVVQRGGQLPAATRRAVKLRDRSRCRAPGCHRRRYVDVHHVVPQELGGEHSRRNCVCLCSTCHGKLHQGLIRLEGDADGELAFFDASVVAREGRAARARRSGERMPHGGSSHLSPSAERLTRVMGERGGWHVDLLCEASGLGAAQVACALLELELAGVARRTTGGYQRCA